MGRGRGSITQDADASLVAESAPEEQPTTTPEANVETPPDGAKPPEQPPAAEAKGPELLTPNEWARRKGLLVDDAREPFAKGFHASAEQLYGWAWHAHNYQAPGQEFRLTEADYDAALVAAGEFPAKPAHEAAVAPHYPKPVVPEQIATACAAAEAKKNATKG